jgi:two-component system, chemotaxis family, sensor kinase Cph1
LSSLGAPRFAHDPRTFPRLAPNEPTDSSNCLRESVRHTPSIQPHGVVLILGLKDNRVVRASLNAAAFFDVSDADIIGADGAALLGDGLAGVLRTPQTSVARLSRTPLSGQLPTGRLTSVVAHFVDDHVIVECEQLEANHAADAGEFQHLVRNAVASMQDTVSLHELWTQAAAAVRILTGFDRVWVYRFEPDGHGVIVAEDKRTDIDSFLGLHYPETDIPPLARELYLQNWLRLIPDSHAEAIPVVARDPLDAGSELIDMGMVACRAVSPVHLRYLANMGVRASMSISLIVDGDLWGMISCHHYEGPHLLSHQARAAAEFVGIVCSMQIAAKTAQADSEYRHHLDRAQGRLLERLSVSETVASGLRDGSADLLELCNAAGVAIVIANEFHLVGNTPAAADVQRLIQRLQERQTSDLYVTDHLCAEYPEFADLTDVASGVIAVPFSRHQGNFIVWFRPEEVQTIAWGDHHTPTTIHTLLHDADSTPRTALNPQTSFLEWAQTVHGHSAMWQHPEVGASESLRSSIGNLLLLRAEQLARANVDLSRANEELDAFAYIASHDLKEPLRGIHTYTSIVIEDYSDALDDQAVKHLESVLRLSRRMGSLVDSLLDYAQVGRNALNVSQIQLHEVLAEALEQMQVRIHEAGAEIVCNQHLPFIVADRDRLQEVLLNLVSNAIKYNTTKHPLVEVGITSISETKRGASVVRRSIGSEREPAVLFVRDNGTGIEADYQEEIFRVFRRLERNDASQTGTGVGLTICRRIVERHGGVIWCESSFGEGSTFFFTLEAQ